MLTIHLKFEGLSFEKELQNVVEKTDDVCVFHLFPS